jgi:hypothetical protein
LAACALPLFWGTLWLQDAIPLQYNDSLGQYEAAVALQPGTYHYR